MRLAFLTDLANQSHRLLCCGFIGFSLGYSSDIPRPTGLLSWPRVCQRLKKRAISYSIPDRELAMG